MSKFNGLNKYKTSIREDEDEVISFKDLKSSLRKASKSNPRIYPCPTCGKKNRLTLQDVNLGYQCDECADKIEGGF
jgi:DNA-directed RNA polymerase subunit RPC12/RpoP